MILAKSFHSTRLETRIKESYSLERAIVSNYKLVMKVNCMEAGNRGTCGGWKIFLKPLSRIQAVRTRKMMSFARVG